ncbi:hypothetical protein NQ176_g807 [Zarea fungicola]|uniref:Uncharacterized protein n=1 Tax=Zarea fungicola TaxID=93591 RepID=A0ACC1NVB6_9HYPO|nr:hypothetical protein NQ176_g807 [Lecanicillium fungicola]
MVNSLELPNKLPHNLIENKFTCWAAIRRYTIETDLGCLTVVRQDCENLRETVAVEPDVVLFERLVQRLDEPRLRMLTIITATESNGVYATKAKERGIKFVGDGGKIMVATLTQMGDCTPEMNLASVDPKFTTSMEEDNLVCSVKVILGDRAVSSGSVMVNDGIATFDGIFTEMDFQRRGLATIVMGYLVRWALNKAASTGVLNASPQGQLLYCKLGWTAVYNIVSLGGQPALDFHARMREKYARK